MFFGQNLRIAKVSNKHTQPRFLGQQRMGHKKNFDYFGK
jgi:hypothetical protein